ncbi:DUF1801 domain-containing protein [Alteraurantiacibacter aquimixticola]|uniref:DUF1801 domain-containing protein n=1 Tax=Alteraurantiacibacter aquimixticola TaxID=2489173 RepID=A0A4T3F4E5_9SPHN|nr:DUF1801 domain-containing protein [Alteraurantiacibacter aquimixticola]TIX50378.1 DUF1801 domain-containing protein [Alteraurantiacibacter aquimixticola]
MSENKTQPTEQSVEAFIEAVDHAGKREDARVLDALFRKVTGEEPRMWGPTIIGYGGYAYETDAGRKGAICRVGFSPRKARHSLYLLNCGKDGDEAPFAALREKLGKFERPKGCIYVNKLADIDLGVLEQMIAMSWKNSKERYPEEV